MITLDVHVEQTTVKRSNRGFSCILDENHRLRCAQLDIKILPTLHTTDRRNQINNSAFAGVKPGVKDEGAD